MEMSEYVRFSFAAYRLCIWFSLLVRTRSNRPVYPTTTTTATDRPNERDSCHFGCYCDNKDEIQIRTHTKRKIYANWIFIRIVYVNLNPFLVVDIVIFIVFPLVYYISKICMRSMSVSVCAVCASHCLLILWVRVNEEFCGICIALSIPNQQSYILSLWLRLAVLGAFSISRPSRIHSTIHP